jgi:hypothetical protein
LDRPEAAVEIFRALLTLKIVTLAFRGKILIKNIVALISLLSIFTMANADALKSEKEIRTLVDSVMQKIVGDDIEGAFKIMQPYLMVSESEFQMAVLNSKSQHSQFFSRYGFTVGHEFIEQKNVGDSLIRITEIEKTEKIVFPWAFYFYKSPKGWVLHSFKWDDKISSLFEGK